VEHEPAATADFENKKISTKVATSLVPTVTNTVRNKIK
jgi:hypothetical protein